MTNRDLVQKLKAQLEALGCDPQLCGRCGSLLNWPKTETEDPLKDAQDEGATINDLFCLCD